MKSSANVCVDHGTLCNDPRVYPTFCNKSAKQGYCYNRKELCLRISSQAISVCFGRNSGSPQQSEVMYVHFVFKGAPTSLISSASYFNLGVETFFGGKVVTGLNFGPLWQLNFGPMWQRGPPPIGGMECGCYGTTSGSPSRKSEVPPNRVWKTLLYGIHPWGRLENSFLKWGRRTKTFLKPWNRGLMLYLVLLGIWQLQNGINKPCVHWMDCDCLVEKLCGHFLYKKKFRYR